MEPHFIDWDSRLLVQLASVSITQTEMCFVCTIAAAQTINRAVFAFSSFPFALIYLFDRIMLIDVRVNCSLGKVYVVQNVQHWKECDCVDACWLRLLTE